MSKEGFGGLVVKEIPYLRAFAIAMTGNHASADDLVQETLVKAWSHHASFAEGTNLRGWLVTILRNTYFTEYRRRQREVQDSEGTLAGRIVIEGGQQGKVEMNDVQTAIDRLPEDQREIVLMIGVLELSYEEASAILKVNIGTVKSRLNRARARLAQLLGLTSGKPA
ncbi:MAG TPA: sigma-70 family RNA polymerase sigma factor [Methylocystis sp.]|nr:sigma-70 family RNA polymerase sigma factor [Methylocystis sp.]